jgi:3-dehydroquinate synthase
MQLRFSPPGVITKVRFFSTEVALNRIFRKQRGPQFWDEGAPIPLGAARDHIQFLAGGERVKRWSSLGKILEILGRAKHERSQPLVVVGGGAVLDLGALAASLYRRGVPLTLVPTTLLGMVDACTGGKTAVDFESPAGLRKNFAGTFYPAREVWIAPHFLASLPERERISGAGECWKMLWIAGERFNDRVLLDYVRTGKLSPALTRIVKQCLAAKIRVVESDPLDTKRRREVLNFGHTAGHALEALGGLSHGEAILWGMAVETTLLGRAGAFMQEKIHHVLRNLKRKPPKAFTGNFEEILLADKKIRGGKIELSLLTRPGKIVKKSFAPERIAGAIRAFPEFYRHASAHLPK